jgi:oligopeptidase A
MDTLSLSMETQLGPQRPVAYLNCNIRPREEGHDAYLTHGDVETLFHEFGHTLHHVAGGSVYRDLSMEGVEWDTIELPSQFMENWTWDKEALRLLSRHKETHEKIPDELVARMTSARYFNAGLFAVRQLLFARYDWDLHTQSVDACTLDPIAYWHELSRTIDVRPPYARNRFPNKFGHIFGGGYTAGYYSYMWALGLAADSFALFEERGNIFDRTIGETFMTEIIRPGSSRPMAESFLAFRARPLDPNALLRHLGLS